jgi:hypothetical protein
MTGPVVPFVVGCQRSGTSLLTVLLDRHSQLAMLPETHLLTRTLWARTGCAVPSSHEHLLLTAWQHDWFRLRDLYFDPQQVRIRMQRHPCTPEGLLTALLELWAERVGKPFAGEKTPQHIEVVERILAGVPNARVTVIIRDGRAVVQSRWRDGKGPAPLDELVDHWVVCARLTERWLTAFPDRVRLTRFEELAAEPGAVLAPLMQWFGLTFEPAQLAPRPSSTFRRWEDRFKRDAEGPIDTARGAAWRSGEELLSAEQLGRMAPWLERFGYPGLTRPAVSSTPVAPAVPPPTVRRPAITPVAPLLLIGAQRAGATTLAAWLATEPAIALVSERQPSPLATGWPLDRNELLQRLTPAEAVDGAAIRVVTDLAPYYLLHPDLPRRARAIVPDARIIVMLRDPVARAYSQWLNAWRMGAELLPFAAALAAESARLGDADSRLQADETAVSFNHVHHSYALRGRYHAQLSRWYDAFPSSQILVLILEELLADPASSWRQLRDFLQLEQTEPPELPHRNGIQWPVTRAKLLRTPEARLLRTALAPDTARLPQLLGRALPWPAAELLEAGSPPPR